MRNFKAHGDTITVTNTTGAAIASGQAVKLDAMFGVAVTPAATGEDFPLKLTGVFELPKAASQAWTVGKAVYWSDVDGNATTTATGNTKIGVAVAAVAGGAGDTLGSVRLNGSF